MTSWRNVIIDWSKEHMRIKLVRLIGQNQSLLKQSIRMTLLSLWWRCTCGSSKRKKLICQWPPSTLNKYSKKESANCSNFLLKAVLGKNRLNRSRNTSILLTQKLRLLTRMSFFLINWANLGIFTSVRSQKITKLEIWSSAYRHCFLVTTEQSLGLMITNTRCYSMNPHSERLTSADFVQISGEANYNFGNWWI